MALLFSFVEKWRMENANSFRFPFSRQQKNILIILFEERRKKLDAIIWTIIGSILVVIGEVIKNNDGKGGD